MLDNAMTRYLKLWGILLCVMCLAYFYMLDHVIFSSTRFTPIFRFLLIEYDIRYAFLGAALCLLAALWNRPEPVVRIVEFLARHPRGTAAATMGVLGVGTLVVYHDYALCMDEYAAVFQSKIFAAGQITARLPPQLVSWLLPTGFNGSFLIASTTTGQAIEAYWPGFALLLAPFQLLKVQWLCNPALAAASIYLIYRITFDITQEHKAAGFAMLFALASGAFIANGISFYSMQAHLTANLLFAWLMLRPTGYRAFAAGVVGSVALVLHNPFPHTLFALPWLAALASDKERRRNLAYVLLGYLPVTLIVGGGWLVLRNMIQAGTHTAPGMSGLANSVFYWPDAGMLNMRAAAFVKMWVWAVPCLLVFAILGYVRHRNNRCVDLLAQSAFLTFLGFLFVNLDQGHGWGYRYFHSAWGAIPILAGCAVTGPLESQRRLISFAGAAAILSLLVAVPYQMTQINQFITEHLQQLPAPKRPGNNVFFVQANCGFYLADMIQMDPFLRDPDLLLVSHGPRRDAEFLRQHWPNAINIKGKYFAQQWYLGDIDQRRSDPPTIGYKRFVIEPVALNQSR